MLRRRRETITAMSGPDSRSLKFRQTGTAKQVWVLVALAAGGLVAAHFYDSGASDPSFTIAMSIAAIVAIAIVAPRNFSSLHNLFGPDGDFDDAPYERDRRGLPPERTKAERSKPNRDAG
jgi:hypothetical protein